MKTHPLGLSAAILIIAALPALAEENQGVESPINLQLENGQVIPAEEILPVTEEGKLEIPKDDKGIFSLVWENDIFAGTDSNYTDGVRASWLSAEEDQLEIVNWIASNLLPGSDTTESANRISLSFGQNIYTPQDISAENLITDDRPYAGHTYASVGIVSDTGKTYDNAQITIGVIGPASGAEETQSLIHRLKDADRPQGWDNQLKNEPTLGFAYERKWRNLYEASPFGVGADFTPHVGAALGNVDIYASTGATFRLGYDLPADYGPARIRPALPGSDFFIPSKELGGYLFATVEGRAVGRNIFLDGNSFQNSHSVNKESFIANLQTGVSLTYDDIRISYTHVFNTREFEEQDKPAQYGVLSLAYRF